VFHDARKADQTDIATDVCIIGAGAAGITIARQLAHTPVSVLLLESGGEEFDAETQTLAQGENISFDDFDVATTRLRFFGGTTNHWGGMTYRLSEADTALRSDIPLSGWPIPYAELASYYPAAEDICQLGGAEWDAVDQWQKATGHVPLRMERGFMVPKVAFFSPPTRFGPVYRRELMAADNINVLLFANAREIIPSDNASHVERIDVQCIGGRRFTVHAKVVVLTLGGLETPRLLLLSRARTPAGLGNAAGNVGRYYMDHPQVAGGQLYLSSGAPDYGFFGPVVRQKGRQVGGLFVPSPDTVEREGIGNFRIMLNPSPSPPAGLESSRALGHFYDDPQVIAHLGRHLANVLLDIDQVTDTLSKNMLGRRTGFLGVPATGTVDGRTAWCSLVAEQFPNPDSRVTLSHETDLFGQQRIRLDWRLQEADLRNMRRAMQIFAASVAACAHGRVRVTGDLLKPDFRHLVGISCHHMGATRMSEDPRTGVVDANLRVHGIDNLYICSSSTFPTGSWVNPTLTIVALAVRLAGHIQRQFS
jgi:choline dehydrogenase-like flavoprotein